MEEESLNKKVKKKKKSRPEKIDNIIFDVIAIVCFVIMAIAVTPKTLQNDTFYNIKCGEYLVKHGIFNVNQDPFSWHNLPYTWPHWLYDICTYIVYAISGNYWKIGIYVVTIILTAILGIALYKTSLKLSKNNRVVSWIITLFTLYLMKSYIAARAQLVTFILFVLEIYFIEKLLETNKKRYGVALLVLSFLVVQFHCAVFPMIFVFAAPYVAEFVFIKVCELDLDEKIFRGIFYLLKKFTNSEEKKTKFEGLIEKSKKNVESRKIKREKRRKNPYKVIIEKNKATVTLIVFLIIAAFIGLLNPMGTGAYTYTLKIYEGNTTSSINEHLPLTLSDNTGFEIMLCVMFIILILFDIKVRLSDLLMFAGTLILAFNSRRQVSLVLIMCMPLLAKFISTFLEKYDKSLSNVIKKLVTSIIGAIAVIAIVVLIAQNLYENKKDENYVEVSSYPVEAAKWLCDYMKNNNISKEDLHLYNEYNYGSYLLLQGIPVFIDSRCDLYTPEFNGDRDIFSDALQVPRLNSDYEGIFEKYDVRYVMLYSNDDVNVKIGSDENYKQLYNDGYFVIYQRLNAE
jgi:hypothetical protein